MDCLTSSTITNTTSKFFLSMNKVKRLFSQRTSRFIYKVNNIIVIVMTDNNEAYYSFRLLVVDIKYKNTKLIYRSNIIQKLNF